MAIVPLPEDEGKRLEAVRSLSAISTEKFAELLQPIVRLAAQICGTPCTNVGLIDHQDWRKIAAFGEGPEQVPRNCSICAYTILSDQPLIVQDIAEDIRFAQSELECDGFAIRFYAGFPIRLQPTDIRVGALSVMDDEPRLLQPVQISMLSSLALVSGWLLRTRLLEKELGVLHPS